MGCDSHPCIEVKGRNGRWGLKEDKTAFWNLGKEQGLSYEEREARKPSYLRILGNRNYLLFAILADVRNGRLGEEAFVEPLFAGRGVPEDVSKGTMEQIPFDSDYHSHTYFTLEELLQTDWDAVAGTRFERLLFAPDFMEWKETGIVSSDAPDYLEAPQTDFNREVSEEEMVMLLLGNTPEELLRRVPDPYEARRGKERLVRFGPAVRVQTPVSYRGCIGHFVESIPEMKKLGEPDKVRVVIAFDN